MITNVDHDVAARSLAETARELYARGWMEGTAGNLSTRLPNEAGHALITASGRGKGRLTAADTVEVRIATGAPVRPDAPRPSAETAIHMALLRLFGDCGAVVHAHPPYATIAAAHAWESDTEAEIPLIRFRDFELIKGFGVRDPAEVAVPVFPNWPRVARIGEDIETHFTGLTPGFPTVLLIAHHGATAWGPDLDSARDRLECLEALCRLRYLNSVATTIQETP
ncbi:methylthioribulose 1-phosphate dehydratase [Microbispora triticiradicis]|uniref:Methylthioribulose-1-phosphate dehydratase n=3 Tax=Microbispora TaxID=2005 RepID=A0ABY3LUL7_9ACTN|nr:methylthioribulose 1-phosphate dehydratase [Microbispora triticiradicis]RGA04734.1 methylthioribulose 1-phosphate dehydratase [Microbispora triticiradicis]TLP52385.1 methylthioribulose 1-phosphate dehydratase [Microbispora fusca]TYB55449.1 methylthioribulose 1-phosphate dehydratase [Microbispora tritici]GLW20627.1 methylthioribulose-1-phosphate dehydratase [Microbispora amethystogenes]